MTQPTLDEAIAARDHAIRRVETNAHQEWLAIADAAVRGCARTYTVFSTDEVWDVLDNVDVHTHEPRAMGAVMKNAVRRGLIEPTGTYIKSSRPKCHARPIPQYRRARN